jgi:O-acetyl-ADP-ribose deacetylase (regulator of RNase III)
MAKLFISYKTGDLNDREGQILYTELKKNHDVFFSPVSLKAGGTWNDEIYEAISTSDVVILLITEDAASPWVQREVAYAMGCGVSILPVVIYAKDVAIASSVMRELELGTTQFVKASGSDKPSSRYADLLESIPNLVFETRKKQEERAKILRETTWKRQDESNPALQPYKPTRLTYATYYYSPPPPLPSHPCAVNITAGNITQIKNVDVVVNSENVYMQMERVFARESVSKRIRTDGAATRGFYIENDTIQNEITEFIKKYHGGITPIPQGAVIYTGSGHQNSKLRQRGIRYIFHVAIQHATLEKSYPIESDTVVRDSIENCLRQVDDLGDVKSIIFPVLASGNAGLDFSVSAKAMIETIKDYLANSSKVSLSNIYISAYTNGNVHELEEIFNKDTDFRRPY